MSSINKFEVIGIFVSVVVMALALVVIRFDSDTLALDLNDSETNNQPASVVVVDESNQNQEAALANAIVDAAPSAELQSLIVDDIEIGTGAEVTEGDTVTVHYVGRLQNGQEFDNSYTKGTPFSFTVGEGKVIAGWETGLLGMQAGGQRILVIPSSLGYGNRAVGPIPAGATLVFAVELLEIN